MSLLPCPFCGNKEIKISSCSGMVTCPRCFCKGPAFRILGKYDESEPTLELASKAWNTRITTGGQGNEK